jgi:hypothetical protein
MSAAGTGAPQFLLTHYISIIYKTQTFQIEKFVFCIILPDSELTEIAAQIPLAGVKTIGILPLGKTFTTSLFACEFLHL